MGPLLCVQIKYLRVPDQRLDAVKEEQNRAREAGRNARGGHGPGGRGGEYRGFLVPVVVLMGHYVVGRGLPARGGEFLPPQLVLSHSNNRVQLVGDAVVQCAADLALGEAGEEANRSPYFFILPGHLELSIRVQQSGPKHRYRRTRVVRRRTPILPSIARHLESLNRSAGCCCTHIHPLYIMV